MTEKRNWRRLPRIGRADVSADVHTEVESHLEMQVADLLAEGWGEGAAWEEARRRFGERRPIEREMQDISRVREREARRTQWLDAFGQDIRYGVRMVRRSPGFAAAVVLTLALGIGANTAVFSAVNAALLRPLPYAESDEVLSIWTRYVPVSGRDYQWMSLSAPELRDYRNSARAISGAAAYSTGRANVATGAAAPDRVRIARVEANLFDVLGTEPLLGRTLAPGDGDVGAPCVVMLSHGLWLEQFGGDTDAVGRSVHVEGERCDVIGVMPAGFFFPNEAIRLWKPFSLASEPRLVDERDSHWLAAVGRLAPGMTLRDVEHELAPMMRAWRAEDDHHLGHFIVMRPFRQDLVGDQRAVLLLLFGAVGLVLLIICANLANLLLTRAESRRREMAVRVALGAGRGRLTRQLLAESMLLALAGGALGLIVAHALMRLLLVLGGTALPLAGTLTLDARVLLYTAAISVVTGVLFGVVPSLHARGVPLQETLRTEGRTATAGSRTARVRQALVVAELAISVAVVAAAMLLVRSYDRLRSVDVGFGTRAAVVADVSLPASAYGEPARIAAFYDELRAGVATLPGVAAVGFVSELPLRAQPGMDGFRIEGRPEPQPGEPSYSGGYVMATPGYFEAAGIPLLSGRLLDDRDVAGAAFVAVVDELAARRYWPDRNPIGQRIRYYGEDSVSVLTIVGVVGTVHYQSPTLPPRPAVYVAHAQSPRSGFYTGRAMTMVARTEGSAAPLVSAVRVVVRRIDPQVPVSNVAMIDDVIAAATGRPRFATGLMGLFALASLLIGALGVYAVLSYLVRARTSEIGIRIALGASLASVHRMVLRQGLGLALIGIAIGCIGAILAGGVLSGMLYDVSATDPFSLALVVLILAFVSFLACYLPARRATRVDPATTLRNG